MKTEIKSKVQKILEAHTTATKGFMAEIDQWNKSTIYAEDYKQEKIKEIKQQIASIDSVFNKKLKDTIAEERLAVIGTPKDKPADYQVQISNALEFVKLAGNKLTDKQAYEILKPFQDDFETMNLFNTVVTNTVPTDLKNNFGKTFGKLYNQTALINSFDTIEKLANQGLFNINENGTLKSGFSLSTFNTHVDDIVKLSEFDETSTQPMRFQELTKTNDETKETEGVQ